MNPLELTSEDMRVYRATARRRQVQMQVELVQRREQAWKVARQSARLLKERFGAARVTLFGSLAHRAWFSHRSDIDLAVWGIPSEQFYRVVAAITNISSEIEVNLVDAEDCRPAIRRAIEREGIDL